MRSIPNKLPQTWLGFQGLFFYSHLWFVWSNSTIHRLRCKNVACLHAAFCSTASHLFFSHLSCPLVPKVISPFQIQSSSSTTTTVLWNLLFQMACKVQWHFLAALSKAKVQRSVYDQVLNELGQKVQPGLTLASVFMNFHTSNRNKASKCGTKLVGAKLLSVWISWKKKCMERKLDLWKIK